MQLAADSKKVKAEKSPGLTNCLKTPSSNLPSKGQLISKAIYVLLTSPKKRTVEFVLFAFLLFTENKSNSSVGFLGESTAC